MLFNSLDFALFLPLVFVLYWFVMAKNLKHQNLLLVVASYVFYGWWDWRFLSLILFSSLVDYVIGFQLKNQEQARKRILLLWLSIFVNIGLLGFFKYYDFFIDNFVAAFSFFGNKIQPNTLNIILPVGISFYTFQTLSYAIDVYKRKLEPTTNLVSFLAFVSFFPQLVAGPIERASNLLPQIQNRRTFNFEYAKSGFNLMIWGLFKKIVIADSCAIYANDIFSNYEQLNSMTLILGSVYFAFQIYCDFSGYSDLAIGISRFFGFNLMQNFNYPYFSRSMTEFWRRWHISLSTWFRDYIYIPLGGSKVSKIKHVRNIFIVFVISGFWHGANWTFIVWGAINAVFLFPLYNWNQYSKIVTNNTAINAFKNGVQIFITFALVCLLWIFFRADTIYMAFDYIKKIFSFTYGIQYLANERYSIELLILIIMFVIVEWFHWKKEDAFSNKYNTVKTVICILAIFMLGNYSNPQDFIYFQF